MIMITDPDQVTDSGRTAMFNCSVSGFPVLNVYWWVDWRFLKISIIKYIIHDKHLNSCKILILDTYWLRNGELVLPSQRVTPGTSTLVIRSGWWWWMIHHPHNQHHHHHHHQGRWEGGRRHVPVHSRQWRRGKPGCCSTCPRRSAYNDDDDGYGYGGQGGLGFGDGGEEEVRWWSKGT